MKYRYWFSTGPVEIEVGNEWMSLLEELDKTDARINYWSQKGIVHYDGLEFEPDFMGNTEKGLNYMFEESPALEYAKTKLQPRAMAVLMHRCLNGYTFPMIGKELGITGSAAGDCYRRNIKRFCKYYSDGDWINSPANLDFPGIGKVLSIPYKLTPDQVVEIRSYRAMCCSLNDIAGKVGVSTNQVLMCLDENPVMQTICPSCGKIIKQSYRKSMKSFCSSACYIRWYKKSCNKSLNRPSSKVRQFLTHDQELILQFYKQMRVSYKKIRKLTGIPLRVITAYFLTKPLPYSICRECGEKIMGQGPNNRVKSFCSQKCLNAYYNRIFYYRKYKGVELYQKPQLRAQECLFNAIRLKENGISYKKIAKRTGLTLYEVESLFRYENDH